MCAGPHAGVPSSRISTAGPSWSSDSAIASTLTANPPETSSTSVKVSRRKLASELRDGSRTERSDARGKLGNAFGPPMFRHGPFLNAPKSKKGGGSFQRPWLRSVVPRSPEHGVLYSYAKLSAYALAVLLIGTTGTQDAVANGDTRTKISSTPTPKKPRASPSSVTALTMLWRSSSSTGSCVTGAPDQPTKMEPRLFDIVWELYRSVGASEGIYVVSAYRAPATNARLRRRSKAVSKYSQHMAGKAMDLFLPGVDIAKVRVAAMRLQYGGVGFYPSVRQLLHPSRRRERACVAPHNSRATLALFPDGKSVHLPSNGPPLPRYEEWRVEVLARGATVTGVSYASADAARRATGGDDEQDFDRGERHPSRSGPRTRLERCNIFADQQRRRGAPCDADRLGGAARGSARRPDLWAKRSTGERAGSCADAAEA